MKNALLPFIKHINLLYTATGNILRHKLRSMVVVLCLIAVLFPFISSVAVLEGVKAQSVISVDEGADIYVTMDLYGKNGVIPIETAGEIKKIEGVVRAVPRVIGRTYIEGRLAVLSGISDDEKPPSLNFIKGSPPGSGEVVIGKALADELKLNIGSSLSIGVRIFAIVDHRPYILKKVYRISGIFDSRSGIWTSRLVMMRMDDLIAMFEMEGFVTDIAVYIRPGSEVSVTEALQRMNPYFRIQTKGLVKSYIERGFNMRGGIFLILYTVAFALAVPAILVSSGFGLSDRKKEIGILKASGWQTHEVMEMVFFENLMLAIAGASAAFILSFIWVRLLNGFFIAQIFIAEAGSMPPFPVPSRFMPLPFILSFFFALILTIVGGMYSTWKTAIVPPAEALR